MISNPRARHIPSNPKLFQMLFIQTQKEDTMGVAFINRRLLGDAAWSTAAMAAYVASQIALVACLAFLASPSEVGELVFAIAVTGPPFMFSNLQLRVVLATDVRQEHEIRSYRTLRLATALGTLLAICLIAFAAFDWHEGQMVVIVFALAKAIESLSDIRLGQLERDERIDVAARSTFMRSVLTLGSFVLCFSTTGSLEAASAAIALAWFAMFLLHDARVTQMPHLNTANVNRITRASKRELVGLLRNALPLGLAALVLSMQLNFPRFWMGYSFGTYDLGIFGLVFQTAIAAQMLSTAFCTPLLPRLSRLNNGINGHVASTCTVGLLAILGTVAGLVAWAILPWVLNATVGHAYTADRSLIVLTCALIPALMIRGGFATVLRAQQGFSILLSGELVALSLQISLTAAIGSRLGIVGPPFALLLALTCSCVLYLVLLVIGSVTSARLATESHNAGVGHSYAA